jgi:hypothetical protein
MIVYSPIAGIRKNNPSPYYREKILNAIAEQTIPCKAVPIFSSVDGVRASFRTYNKKRFESETQAREFIKQKAVENDDEICCMIDRDVLFTSLTAVEELLTLINADTSIGALYFKGNDIDIGAGIWRVSCLSKIDFIGFMDTYKPGMCGADFEIYVKNQIEKSGFTLKSTSVQYVTEM